MTHKYPRYIDVFSYVFIAIYTLAAMLVSVNRFWQYEVFYYDFGIFDQAIWNVAHFKPPVIDHFVIPGKVIFADHFSPSIFLLSPIYWITNRPEALLIAQSLAVGLSAVVLYLIGKKLLKHPIGAFGVTVAYLLFVGTQNALISDIHEITFMTLPLALTLYALVTKNLKLFWISFIVTLGFKESAAATGIALAVLLWITDRKWWKQALAVIGISVAWGFMATQVIIPYFYGHGYFYTPKVYGNLITELRMFIDDPVKVKTIWISLLSFGFLPIMYPPAWPLIVQDLATRFLQTDFPLRWGLGLHYSAQLAVILAFSSIMSLKYFESRVKQRHIIPVISGVLILLSLYLHQFKLHGPLGLAYNPAFYRHTKDFRFLDNLISRVPKSSSVMTQNNIAPHLIHTNHVYLTRDVYTDFMPEYFVLDLRPGQNLNDFFGVHIDTLKLTLSKDSRYKVIFQTRDQYIYKKSKGGCALWQTRRVGRMPHGR